MALATAFVAGLVRGFAGFGSGLIFMPVAAAVLDPKMAVVALLLIDNGLTVPMAARATALADWSTIVPTFVAAAVAAPFGALILAHGDPVALRWIICVAVGGLLVLLASGIRYHGQPRPATALAVGAGAGLLGGIAQIAGPPLIVFWMSGPNPPAVVRANMLVFFALLSIVSFVLYLWHGFFTVAALEVTLLFIPVYALALFLGAWFFRTSGGRAYRPLAYAVIALSALTSLPIFDGWLR